MGRRRGTATDTPLEYMDIHGIFLDVWDNMRTTSEALRVRDPAVVESVQWIIRNNYERMAGT